MATIDDEKEENSPFQAVSYETLQKDLENDEEVTEFTIPSLWEI